MFRSRINLFTQKSILIHQFYVEVNKGKDKRQHYLHLHFDCAYFMLLSLNKAIVNEDLNSSLVFQGVIRINLELTTKRVKIKCKLRFKLEIEFVIIISNMLSSAIVMARAWKRNNTLIISRSRFKRTARETPHKKKVRHFNYFSMSYYAYYFKLISQH